MQTVPACWLKLRVGDDLMCPLLCPLWIESGVTPYKSWFSRIGAKCLILLTQYDTVRNQLNGLVPAVTGGLLARVQPEEPPSFQAFSKIALFSRQRVCGGFCVESRKDTFEFSAGVRFRGECLLRFPPQASWFGALPCSWLQPSRRLVSSARTPRSSGNTALHQRSPRPPSVVKEWSTYQSLA